MPVISGFFHSFTLSRKRKLESTGATSIAKIKAPRSAKKGTGARDGSKTATILEMLKRPGGATAQELLKATGWQPHTVRGVVSGALKKKLGLAVTSDKEERGRVYRIVAPAGR